MSDPKLKRDDGVLIRSGGELETRAYEIGASIILVEWWRNLGRWTCDDDCDVRIGTRAELAALAKAFPAEPDRG